jgi:hypothetical protein
MAPIVEEMQGFKQAWQMALDSHHSAINECRSVLGLDSLKSKKGLNRQKLGLAGAFAGALLGYGIFSASKPLEMLRMAIDKVSEALKTYGVGVTDGYSPSPEDAPLT